MAAARADLAQRGLPVPKPVAARYQRSGLWYRCDLITQRIMDAHPLSAVLAQGARLQATWRAVGAAVARLHRAGVDHADLNAHNILLDAGGIVSVIDFDRGRLRTPGAWTSRNLRRSALARKKSPPHCRKDDSRNWHPGKSCWLRYRRRVEMTRRSYSLLIYCAVPLAFAWDAGGGACAILPLARAERALRVGQPCKRRPKYLAACG